MRRRILKKSDSVIADILEDDVPRVKAQKKKYIRPSIAQIKDEYWSDEEEGESEDRYGKLIISNESDENKSSSSSQMKENYITQSKLGVGVSTKPKSSKLFDGKIKILNPHFSDEKKEENHLNLTIPLPYVPSHVIDILSQRTIQLLWKEFLSYGSDETELLEIEYLPLIAERMALTCDMKLPFDQITFPIGESEYTDFTYVINSLAKLLNQPGVIKTRQSDRIYLPPCCANQSCQLHTRINQKYQSGNEIRSNFRLDVIFRRMIVERNGVVRISHIPEMLREAEIPFSLNNLPSNYMTLHGDELITSYDVLFDNVEKLRGDTDANTETLERLYALPKWLQNEFTPNEILLFRHHFMMIDIDCGGTIDKHELQLLGESLGNTISEEEAMKIIAEHCSDGEESLNFEEFMTLMFQILRGTIDVQNDVLAKTMMESRNQIKIFEEIESIKSFQPIGQQPPTTTGSLQSGSIDAHSNTTLSSTFSLSFVKVLHYGQVPVVCEYLLKGPIHSPYAKGKFVIKVIYNNGYPFQCPTVTISTRLLHVNFLPLIGGSYAIPHLEAIWDSSWTTRDLLEHIYELLQCPNPRLLPEDMIEVYNRYVTEFYEITDPSMLITSVFQQRRNEQVESSEKEREQKEQEGDDGDSEEKESDMQSSLTGGKSYEDVLKRMPRMRQYHMNIILKYFVDNETYEDLVRQGVDIYARKKEYDLEEEEDEDGVDDETAEEKEVDPDEIDDEDEGIEESLGEEKYSQEEFEDDDGA